MSNKMINCVICGKSFEKTSSNMKYCSLECQKENIRRKRIKWKNDNPNYYKDYFERTRHDEHKRITVYYRADDELGIFTEIRIVATTEYANQIERILKKEIGKKTKVIVER